MNSTTTPATTHLEMEMTRVPNPQHAANLGPLEAVGRMNLPKASLSGPAMGQTVPWRRALETPGAPS